MGGLTIPRRKRPSKAFALSWPNAIVVDLRRGFGCNSPACLTRRRRLETDRTLTPDPSRRDAGEGILSFPRGAFHEYASKDPARVSPECRRGHRGAGDTVARLRTGVSEQADQDHRRVCAGRDHRCAAAHPGAGNEQTPRAARRRRESGRSGRQHRHDVRGAVSAGRLHIARHEHRADRRVAAYVEDDGRSDEGPGAHLAVRRRRPVPDDPGGAAGEELQGVRRAGQEESGQDVPRRCRLRRQHASVPRVLQAARRA